MKTSVHTPNVKSAIRVFEVLEALREAAGPLTAVEISRRLGYPLSSASVLLRNLAGLGYLSLETAARKYYPAPRLIALGEWLANGNLLDPGLKAAATELRRITGDTVALTRVRDLRLEFVFIEISRQHFGLAIGSGATAPVCQTINGHTWLATRPDDEVRMLVARHNAAYRSGERVNEQNLMRRIRTIRHKGYAAAPAPMFPGFAMVALPVRDRTREEISVLGIALVSQELARREHAIITSAREVLGGRRYEFGEPVRRAAKGI